MLSIDLGVLGKADLHHFVRDGDWEIDDKVILFDGFTEWGVRVHVIEGDSFPRIWNNAVVVGFDWVVQEGE